MFGSIHRTTPLEIALDTLLRTGNCYIAGSTVYKGVILGDTENVGDVDIACSNVVKAFETIKRLCTVTVRHKDLEDIYNVEFVGDDAVPNDPYDRKLAYAITANERNVDIIPKHVYDKTADKFNSFIHNIRIEHNTLRHKDDDEKQMRFIVENLRNGKYCKWSGMRAKDHEYFKDFVVIDSDVCKSYGL
jgi:hypothetical protein